MGERFMVHEFGWCDRSFVTVHKPESILKALALYDDYASRSRFVEWVYDESQTVRLGVRLEVIRFVETYAPVPDSVLDAYWVAGKDYDRMMSRRPMGSVRSWSFDKRADNTVRPVKRGQKVESFDVVSAMSDLFG